MSPSILPGDEVLVGRANQALGPGDVVVRFGENSLVIHRVIACLQIGGSARVFVTKGDNSRTIDSVCSEDDILGLALSISRAGRECRIRGGLVRCLGRGFAWLSGLRLEGITERGTQRIRDGESVADSIQLRQNGNHVLKFLVFGFRWIHGLIVRMMLRIPG